MDPSVEKKLTINWNQLDPKGNKMTFFGVLYKYYDIVAKHWRSIDTQRNYMGNYNDFLLEQVKDRPLEDFDREDFDDAIEAVCAALKDDGRKAGEDQRQHYRVLIRRVTQTAAEVGICPDVLWGTNYGEQKTADDKESVILKRNRRSLTEQEELQVYASVMEDETQSGAKMGLALMFCLGLRNNEACGLDFGDIRPLPTHPDCFCAYIYKSTKRGSSERKYSGKTRNAIRMIPVPERLLDLIQRRREYIVGEIRAGRYVVEGLSQACTDEEMNSVIDRMPVVCVDRDFSAFSKTHPVTIAAMKMFRDDISMEESVLRQVDTELRGSAAQSDQEDEDFLEKEPTAYLLRRNFGTRLYQLGLTEPEIQYIIGHDIETETETRAGYRNEEKLYPIYLKMWRRFLVNSVEPLELIIEDTLTNIADETEVMLHIPCKRRGRVQIEIHSNEADSELRISTRAKGIRTSAQLLRWPDLREKRETVNAMEIMRKRYDSALKKERSKEAQNDEEKT